ncbi:phosphoribosyltransferase family protein [Solibacillus sp. CAU 1738]|uniref:ComF family protein n=1 Tax=Solibacillus sp. CAU 1738 TaxID=3140363 RepID=UPI00325FF31C
MKKEIYYCLLCERELQNIVTWQTLLERNWPQTICDKCAGKFELNDNIEDSVQILYSYNEAMKDYLHQYKFMHDVVLAKVFRNEIHLALSHRTETMVPIPMHPEKLRQRTFAHVDELLNAAQISYIHLLEKTTTDTQVGKSKEERQRVASLFQIDINKQVEPKDYLIVDDIYTTGTTIKHAQQTLLDAGAKSVTAFVLIRG